MKLMNDVIIGGQYWPFDEIFDMDGYRDYYLSHAAFAVRANNDIPNRNVKADQVIGTFYVKPNFPGRCGHICNGGFITKPSMRGLGVATLMASSYLHCVKALGYRSSLFNLVFTSNLPSLKIWEKLGFVRTGLVPGT